MALPLNTTSSHPHGPEAKEGGVPHLLQASAPWVNEALEKEIRRLELPTSTVERQRLQQGRPPMDRRLPVEPESVDIED